MNNKLLELFPNIQSKDNSYISAISKNYEDYISYSEIPRVSFNNVIDTKSLPKRLKILNDNIYEIVTDSYNLVFNMLDYSNTAYISYMLLNSYFKYCVDSDSLVDTIVYADTNLILDDYKKLMDNESTGISPSLTYKVDTLYNNLENAKYVIWDKFTLVNSNYDKQKLYNILLIRHRKALGNLFFIKGGPSEIGKIYDVETYYAMDISAVVDCSNEQVIFKENNKKGNIEW